MLYRLTRSIVRHGIRGFFNHIKPSGVERLNNPIPTIAIVNHPSALIDPLVLATISDRKQHYIAAAEYFGKGLVKSLLRNEYNMIPVYRPELYEGQEVNNEDMFRECYDCLDRNGCIIIFPEGNSVTEKQLRPLKTGVARIILGFKNKFPDRELQVLPIGLIYEDAHRFQSDVLVNIGKPFVYREWEPTSLDQEQAAIISTTNDLEKALQKEILHFDQSQLEPLVSQINSIVGLEFFTKLEKSVQKWQYKFRQEQLLIKSIEQLQTEQPAALADLDTKVKSYLKHLDQLDLKPNDVVQIRFKLSQESLKLLLGLLPFLLGLVINILPFWMSSSFFKNKLAPKITDYGVKGGPSPAFVATLKYATGVITFLIWYISIGITVSFITLWWAGIIFFFGSYWLGRFSLQYLSWLKSFRNHLRQKNKHKKLREKLDELKSERDQILKEVKNYCPYLNVEL